MRFLITAANRGLGLEFATQLLERGDEVICTARQPSESRELQALVERFADTARLIQLDVTDPTSVAQLAEALDGERVDILINNAGRLSRGGGPQQGFDYEEISKDFEVNVVGTLRVTEACLPMLKRSDTPRIVNISSKMGSIGDNTSGGTYAYRMAKAALNMATRSLAKDLADEGVVAVVFHPGWVKTRMGGPNALITAEQSISGMLETIDALDADHTGRFYEWSGGEVQW